MVYSNAVLELFKFKSLGRQMPEALLRTIEGETHKEMPWMVWCQIMEFGTQIEKQEAMKKIQHLATENDESKEVEANTNDEEAGSDNFGSEEDTSENVE